MRPVCADQPRPLTSRYALAVETSDGGYRPATESEVGALEELQIGAAPADRADGSAAPQATPSSVGLGGG